MGAALNALNEKLSVSHGFMKHAVGLVTPVLILFMDGEPTDDYRDGLQKLKNNNWYKFAARVAVGYGEANDDVLREFTGNSETVLHTIDPREIINMIKFYPYDNTQNIVKAFQNYGALTSPDVDEEW